jgi:transcriptional regulator GlxA family with amidase domain
MISHGIVIQVFNSPGILIRLIQGIKRRCINIVIAGSELEKLKHMQMPLTISIHHYRLTSGIAAFIRERCRAGDATSLTYASLTKRFAISETALKVTFRRRYRQSIHAYIMNERIKYIAELLQTTNRTISEIAIMAGYSEISNCSRDFTKQTGVSPTLYRQQLYRPHTIAFTNPQLITHNL